MRFHPSVGSFLLTGGMDGLVNVFDIEEGCEDDALLYTLNAECAVVSRLPFRASLVGVWLSLTYLNFNHGVIVKRGRIHVFINCVLLQNRVSWLGRTAADVDRVAVITTEEEFQWWEAEDVEPRFRKSRERLAEGGPRNDKACSYSRKKNVSLGHFGKK